MSQPVVTFAIDGYVAKITLDPPDAGNRVNQRLVADLEEVCEQIEQDRQVRVVILTGAGATFCLGTDDEAFHGGGMWTETITAYRISGCLESVTKPIVVAINGDAIDQGLELALACDLRVAAQEARFGLTHVRRGLIPWDGGTQRLPRLVGAGRATELILTSRVIGATEAHRIGLVSEVVEAGESLNRATEIAKGIAEHGPIAVRYVKEAVIQGQDLILGQGLRLEADLSFLLHGTVDRAKGIRSFLDRTEPDYRDE